ncbi:MAG TPA: oxygenase MpaB family protein [Acidimicrobiia bacterium]|jgi:uncharacterized protein (DUF2236 family)
MSDDNSSRIEGLRQRIVSSATAPFRHAPYPLARSLDYRGDPGLYGPGSVSWAVLADVATFVGGVRGLLIQAAHPEVVAGVGGHSRYKEDPLGRLSRTTSYVTATTYGAMPEVEQAVAQVQRIHRMVSGVSSRGVSYDAADPGFSAWVHNALTDSFLVAHRTFGRVALSRAEEDRFVAEQTRAGALLGSDPMPSTASALSAWIEHHPEIAPSPEMWEAVDFLADPPLDPGLKVGYKTLFEAAVATIPTRVRSILGLTKVPGATSVGRVAVAGLRWALGYSPSWQLALVRTGAPIPDRKFRQPLPVTIR